jgi:cytidylate kinase
MAVITISREPGALGEELAARVAGQLGFVLVDRSQVARLWREVDLDDTSLECVDEFIPNGDHELDPETEASIKLLPDLIVQMAEEHDLVIIGRGAQGLFRNRPGAFHIKIIGSRKFRVRNLQVSGDISARQARRRLRELEYQRIRYLRYLYGTNWNDPCLYDLILRMDRLSIEEATNMMVAAIEKTAIRRISRRLIVENLLPEDIDRREYGPFANAAEEEFASFLEFYGIPFEYEPRSFTLETNENGDVVEAFTPDFYLTDQDLFIELTTMKQSLVTRKNRKVRKLRRLYPEINLRIFYQRDFYRLMAKFGLLADQTDSAGDGRHRVNKQSGQAASNSGATTGDEN